MGVSPFPVCLSRRPVPAGAFPQGNITHAPKDPLTDFPPDCPLETTPEHIKQACGLLLFVN